MLLLLPQISFLKMLLRAWEGFKVLKMLSYTLKILRLEEKKFNNTKILNLLNFLQALKH